MRQTLKRSILGRRISKAQALKGLGDPKTWAQENAALYAEFHSRVQTTSKVVSLNAAGISSRIFNALSKVGISPPQARKMPDVTLRKVAGIGKASLKEIRQKLGRSSGKRSKAKKRKR